MSKIEQARRTRQSFEIELSKFSYLSSLQPAHRNPQDEASVGHIQLQVEALSREEELLALDLKLLQQYMNDDLIRLPSGGALETKIEVGPSEPGLSMHRASFKGHSLTYSFLFCLSSAVRGGRQGEEWQGYQ